jgi:mycobactin lysine-N-oxygenase
MSANSLTIIGAGPKALAIAAKACVLAKLGFSVPRIRIIEKDEIGAYWKPGTGFTNGLLKLGTSPEKDLGFPYASSCWGDDFNKTIDQEMRRFSWQSFMVERGLYAAWIDRGRPAPEHKLWAEYLGWAFKKVQREFQGGIEMVQAEFQELELASYDSWRVHARSKDGTEFCFETGGVCMTGPGEIKQPVVPDDPGIMDVRTFWSRIKDLTAVEKETYVAIVGTGETAASTAAVVGHLDAPLCIDVIAPVAMSYSRGESFVENHMYTDPFQGNWHELTVDDRRTFIERTDRGVFSLATKKELDVMGHVNIIPGRFRSVKRGSSGELMVELDYNGAPELRAYDYVILAIGFDPLQFLTQRTSDETRNEIMNRAEMKSWSAESVEMKIEEDLSLSGLLPRLHLPMMAALQQGPGFPNLSSLGRLSDHVLLSYVSLDRESDLA